MFVIDPTNHTKANKKWETVCAGVPNGARTLGLSVSKYLAPTFFPYYDLLITYCANVPFDMPEDVKKIAVIHHQNYPRIAAVKGWRELNRMYSGYTLDFFCNVEEVVDLFREQQAFHHSKGKTFFLPRFIDTTTMPEPKEKKEIPTLWFGNRYGAFEKQFSQYLKKNEHPYWLSKNVFGVGERELFKIEDREDVLEIVNSAREVWAIGICQLEAKYLGATTHSFIRNGDLPLYTEKTIVPYLEELLRSQDRKEPNS